MDSVYKRKDMCCGCALCEARCPQRAIRMSADGEGFLYPVIDRERCVDCGVCLRICPMRRKGNFKEEGEPRFFAATHRSEEVLKKSTSGGAFTALSDILLEGGGSVCGALFDEKLRVVHRVASSREGRDEMRLSKYVQSDMRGLYEGLREALEAGGALFSGTPCQCAAVRSFFEGSPLSARLFLCDVICHSVTSPLVWEEYKKLLEAEKGGKLAEVFFRSKRRPWLRANSNGGLAYRMEASEEIFEDDRFYELFIYMGTISRPSCERCPFADLRRPSDMTVADCFGIEKYAPELYDSLGVSLIMSSSDKGEKMLAELSKSMNINERPKAEIMAEQQRLSAPGAFPPERAAFWETFRDEGLERAIEKYARRGAES